MEKASSEADRALRRAQVFEAYWRECDGAAREEMMRMGDEMTWIRRDNEEMGQELCDLRDREEHYVCGEPPSPR